MNSHRSSKHLVLRAAIASLGAGIMIWLVVQLRTGVILWNVSDSISNETIAQYSASSSAAKLVAAALFGLLSLGLIAYGLFPCLVYHRFLVIPWILIMVILGLLLKPLSEKIGP
jgi:hypothetical protein